MLRLTHPYPPLTDGVVLLRAPRESDAEALHEAAQDPEIARWTSVPENYTLELAQAYIADSLAAVREGRRVNLFALRSAGGLVGVYGTPVLDRATRTAELGYWVAEPMRGQGLGTRALVLFRDWLHESVGFRRLELLIHIDNPRSRRMGERAGFADTGERRPNPRPAPGEESMERNYLVLASVRP
jgi:RimJ/RimL family protein N-acetyltransferase